MFYQRRFFSMQAEPEIQQGFLLTRSSRDFSGQAQIVLWIKTSKGPARLVIEGEQPVFFIETGLMAEVERLLKQAQIPLNSRSLPMTTFGHQSVSALYFNTLSQSYDAQTCLKNAGITLLEADIRLHDRYLMERFVYGGLEFIGQPIQKDGYIEYRQARIRASEFRPNFEALSLDIECSEKGELYSIGLSSDDFQKVLMIGEEQEAPEWIQWVPSEKALLLSLQEAFYQFDPDIVIGWSVVNFDFRLLLKRAAKYGIRLRLGRGKQVATWRDRRGESDQGFVTLPGRVVIDGIDALKAATYHFESFSLEYVSQTLLGRGKATEDVDNRMETINHDFHHNKVKLATYNLEDCRLVEAIFEKTRILDYLRLRSQLTGLELDRMGGSVQAFTNLYLPKLHRGGFIAPNLPEGGGLASPGGYVMDSIPGLYDNVLVLDFKSLYPSIIRTFKIDPMGLIKGLATPDSAIPGFRGACFSRDEHFLPDIITSLWQQRDQAKLQKDSARSQALKIIMNSFYGVLGSGGCRFYDTRLASSITMRGHEIMQQTARWIEAMGFKVIYGDTDSTFVLLGQQFSQEEARKVGKQLESEINSRWQEKLASELNLECALELEFETLYRKFLMPTIRGSETGSKKRYAGIKATTAGDELVFKGLETVRSDWTELAKQFQTQLFSMVFAGDNPQTYIKQIVNETLSGQRDNELIYRKRLRKKLDQYVKNVPPQVKAARRADQLNRLKGKPLQYQRKGWISYCITTNGPEPVEYLSSPVDYQHYIDKQLKPVADGILPFIGLDFNELVDAQSPLFP